MKKAKTIKIFPAPHVEVRLHVSKEMVKDYKACYDTGGLGQPCTECSWFNVKIGGAADKPPDSVTRTINAMKAVAAIDEFEVFGRIKLRDKKTGKIYR